MTALAGFTGTPRWGVRRGGHGCAECLDVVQQEGRRPAPPFETACQSNLLAVGCAGEGRQRRALAHQSHGDGQRLQGIENIPVGDLGTRAGLQLRDRQRILSILHRDHPPRQRDDAGRRCADVALDPQPHRERPDRSRDGGNRNEGDSQGDYQRGRASHLRPGAERGSDRLAKASD